MTVFFSLLFCVCMFALLMIPGWILGKCGRFMESAKKTLANLLTDVAMPALVLCKLLEVRRNLISIPALLLCLLFPAVLIPLLCLITRLIWKKGTAGSAEARFCSIFPNCGFLGIPIATALYPDAPEVAVYVSVFNVLSTVLLLTLGTTILSPDQNKRSPKNLFISPVTVCALLGFLILALDLGSYCGVLTTYTSYFAAMTVPLSMLVLGYELCKLPLRKMISTLTLYGVSALKLIVSPIITLLILLLIRCTGFMDISEHLAMALMLASGVSTAASAPAMASAYGRDSSKAAIFTLGTTLIGIVILPFLGMLYQWIFF